MAGVGGSIPPVPTSWGTPCQTDGVSRLIYFAKNKSGDRGERAETTIRGIWLLIEKLIIAAHTLR